MASIDISVFDCDHHYYEARVAFTRHVAKPTWNPIATPGAMHEYFRGNPHDPTRELNELRPA